MDYVVKTYIPFVKGCLFAEALEGLLSSGLVAGTLRLSIRPHFPWV